jgi:hypothetical protein
MTAMIDIRYRAIQQSARDLPDPTKVVPFGYGGAGLWTGHPIGLVMVVGLLTMGILGLPEARWFLAFAAPAGAICGFFMWLHHRNGLSGRKITRPPMSLTY